MKQPILEVILIADKKGAIKQVTKLFEAEGMKKANVVSVASDEAQETIAKAMPELVILDDDLKGSESNQDLLRAIRDAHPTMSILMLTRKSDRKGGVVAMKLGATDYIFKRDLNEEVFDRSVRYCVERKAHLEGTHQRNLVIDALFDQATDVLCLMDAEDHVTLSNEVFDQRFGMDTKAAKRFLSFLQAQGGLGEQVRLIDLDMAEPLTFFAQEGEELKKYRLTVRRIDVGLDTWRVLVRLKDITVEYKAEQEQLLVEKLKLTERMARILAHEIRNPLTNVQLSVDYMKDAFKGNEDLDMYVEIIERNAVRIDDLVNHILKSIEPFEVKPSKVDPKRYFADVAAKMEDRRELLGAEMEVSIETSRKEVVIDEDKMELALVNLMSNAFDAMSQVEEPALSLKVSDHATGIQVVVSDNGKGMSSEEVEKVFEAFFSKRRGGIGLGTTMIKNIITAHGGVIAVDSEPGVGTTFTIVLPMP